MGFDAQGKVVLVSGANRGIRKAMVDSLIQHGAKTVYAGIRSLNTAKPLVKAYGNEVIPVPVDNEITPNRCHVVHLTHVNAHVQFPHR